MCNEDKELKLLQNIFHSLHNSYSSLFQLVCQFQLGTSDMWTLKRGVRFYMKRMYTFVCSITPITDKLSKYIRQAYRLLKRKIRLNQNIMLGSADRFTPYQKLKFSHDRLRGTDIHKTINYLRQHQH